MKKMIPTVITSLMLAVLACASSAHAQRVFGLTTILTNSDCNYLVGAVNILSTGNVRIDSHCQPGSYGTNDAGKYYSNAAITNLNLYMTQVTGSIPLQSIVTAGNCEYLASSFKLLSTSQTTISSKCSYGSYRGGDGRIYPAKIDTSVSFNFSTQSSHKPSRKGFMVDRNKIGHISRLRK